MRNRKLFAVVVCGLGQRLGDVATGDGEDRTRAIGGAAVSEAKIHPRFRYLYFSYSGRELRYGRAKKQGILLLR